MVIQAFDANEVPIGAVLVHEGTVVATARNEVERRSDPTAHAELLCIQKGAKLLGAMKRSLLWVPVACSFSFLFLVKLLDFRL